MHPDLHMKCALVTGSTSGIGKVVAQMLVRAGAHVVINGLIDDEAALMDEMRQLCPNPDAQRLIFHGCDLVDVAAMESMVSDLGKQIGGVDILINNAGIQHVAPIAQFPTQKWDQIIAINLSSNFHMIRLCMDYMQSQSWGRIINIASAHGLVASPFKSAYVAAKHGVVGLTKTVALECAEHGITCNAICPGFVHTEMVDAQIKEQAKAHNLPEDKIVSDVILASQPSKKFVKASDVGDMVLYLCSPGAASITGSALSIDGGWVAR